MGRMVEEEGLDEETRSVLFQMGRMVEEEEEEKTRSLLNCFRWAGWLMSL